MAKGSTGTRPWCPFCGVDVGRPTDSVQRAMTEFPLGRCQCGAVYVADATGHNVGAAMVECLVHACGDNWDLAWELLPEEDYLTGRIEHYDENDHEVIEAGHKDGRAVRGVLYFVRLHKEISEISERLAEKKRQEEKQALKKSGAAQPQPPPVPAPSADGKRRRADKRTVRRLVEADQVDELAALALDDRRTLRFIQRMLYDPLPDSRFHTAWILGQVCARVSTRDPGQVADLMHRLFEACSDSAATSWGMVEAIASIIAARSDLYGAFTRHLLAYMGDASTQEAVLWGLAEIAAPRPDLIRRTPFYTTFHFLGHPEPGVRAQTVRLLGRIGAKEALMQIMGLQNDDSQVIVHEQGRPRTTTVADLASEAVAAIHRPEGDSQ